MPAAKPKKVAKRKPMVATRASRGAGKLSPPAAQPPYEVKAPVDTPRARQQALTELHSELRAIPKRKLLKINGNVLAAAKVVLQCVPHVAPYLPRIATLPEVNQALVKNLEKIALAMLAAGANRPASKYKVRADIAAAYQEGIELKELLRDCVKLLIKRGLLPSNSLTFPEGARGYVNTGKDLTGLAQIFSRHAEAIRGKSPITLQDIERAQVLGKLLAGAGDDRYRFTPEQEAAELLFHQAHTLLLMAYNEVRRCIRFLDPEAEPRVVPPLFPRMRRKNGASSADAHGEVGTAPRRGRSTRPEA